MPPKKAGTNTGTVGKSKSNSSQTRLWERERRERLNVAFNELELLLPNHDPALTTSKLDILLKAAKYIKELGDENKKVLNEGIDESHSQQLSHLRSRVDELLSRVQQLSKLLRDAGISIPVATNSEVKLKRPTRWTKKIKAEDTNMLLDKVKQNHAEERKKKAEARKKKLVRSEPIKTKSTLSLTTKKPLNAAVLNSSNIPSKLSKSKRKKKKMKDDGKIVNAREQAKTPSPGNILNSSVLGLSTANVQAPQTDSPSSNAALMQALQRFIIIQDNIVTTPPSSTVIPQPPCLMMSNDRSVVKTNPLSLVLNSEQPRPMTKSHTMAPIMATGLQTTRRPALDQGSSLARLGPGTLIFPNGNIVPVLQPPPTILTPVVVSCGKIVVQNNVTTVASSVAVTKQLVSVTKPSPSGLAKLVPKRRAKTTTTFANKVPIPSLSSMYVEVDSPTKLISTPKKPTQNVQKSPICKKKLVGSMAKNIKNVNKRPHDCDGEPKIESTLNQKLDSTMNIFTKSVQVKTIGAEKLDRPVSSTATSTAIDNTQCRSSEIITEDMSVVTVVSVTDSVGVPSEEEMNLNSTREPNFTNSSETNEEVHSSSSNDAAADVNSTSGSDSREKSSNVLVVGRKSMSESDENANASSDKHDALEALLIATTDAVIETKQDNMIITTSTATQLLLNVTSKHNVVVSSTANATSNNITTSTSVTDPQKSKASPNVAKLSNSGSYTIDALCKLRRNSNLDENVKNNTVEIDGSANKEAEASIIFSECLKMVGKDSDNVFTKVTESVQEMVDSTCVVKMTGAHTDFDNQQEVFDSSNVNTSRCNTLPTFDCSFNLQQKSRDMNVTKLDKSLHLESASVSLAPVLNSATSLSEFSKPVTVMAEAPVVMSYSTKHSSIAALMEMVTTTYSSKLTSTSPLVESPTSVHLSKHGSKVPEMQSLPVLYASKQTHTVIHTDPLAIYNTKHISTSQIQDTVTTTCYPSSIASSSVVGLESVPSTVNASKKRQPLSTFLYTSKQPSMFSASETVITTVTASQPTGSVPNTLYTSPQMTTLTTSVYTPQVSASKQTTALLPSEFLPTSVYTSKQNPLLFSEAGGNTVCSSKQASSLTSVEYASKSVHVSKEMAPQSASEPALTSLSSKPTNLAINSVSKTSYSLTNMNISPLVGTESHNLYSSKQTNATKDVKPSSSFYSSKQTDSSLEQVVTSTFSSIEASTVSEGEKAPSIMYTPKQINSAPSVESVVTSFYSSKETNTQPLESGTNTFYSSKETSTVVGMESIVPSFYSSEQQRPPCGSNENKFLSLPLPTTSSLSYFPPITTNSFLSHTDNNSFIPISSDMSKNLDSDSAYVHSSLSLAIQNHEFSNDIFASLQVPSGSQHPESISPTAAFLLAFPLVSSSKVTEMMDVHEEAGSDSLQGTPTLLQIGNIDSDIACLPRSSSQSSTKEATENTQSILEPSKTSKYVETPLSRSDEVTPSVLQETQDHSKKFEDRNVMDSTKPHFFEAEGSNATYLGSPSTSDPSFLAPFKSITKYQEPKPRTNQYHPLKSDASSSDTRKTSSFSQENMFTHSQTSCLDPAPISTLNPSTNSTKNVGMASSQNQTTVFQSFNQIVSKDNSCPPTYTSSSISKQQACNKFNTSNTTPQHANVPNSFSMNTYILPTTSASKNMTSEVKYDAAKVKTSTAVEPPQSGIQPYSYNLFNNDYSTTSTNFLQAQTIAGGESSFSMAQHSSNSSIMSWTTLSPMANSTNTGQQDSFGNGHSIQGPQQNFNIAKGTAQGGNNVNHVHRENPTKSTGGNDRSQKLATFQNLFAQEGRHENAASQFQRLGSSNVGHETHGNFKCQNIDAPSRSRHGENVGFGGKKAVANQSHRPPVNWMTAPDSRQQSFSAAGPDSLHQKQYDPALNQNIFTRGNLQTSNYDSRNFTSSSIYGNSMHLSNADRPPDMTCQNEFVHEQVPPHGRITDLSEAQGESYALNWNSKKSSFASGLPDINSSILMPSTLPLPTLVGDLALGTNYSTSNEEQNKPMLYNFDTETRKNIDCQRGNASKHLPNKLEKEDAKNRSKPTPDYSGSNFLSVSQLVEQPKSGVSARNTAARRNGRNTVNKQSVSRQNATKRGSNSVEGGPVKMPRQEGQSHYHESERKEMPNRSGPSYLSSAPQEPTSGYSFGREVQNSISMQWSNPSVDMKQNRSNYKTPVSNYSAEALIGPSVPSGQVADNGTKAREMSKVVSLPPPMVSEKFSNSSCTQTRRPPFAADILHTNYFGAAETTHHDGQSTHVFQNHNYMNPTFSYATTVNSVGSAPLTTSQNARLYHSSSNFVPNVSSSNPVPSISGGFLPDLECNNFSSGILAPDPTSLMFPPSSAAPRAAGINHPSNSRANVTYTGGNGTSVYNCSQGNRQDASQGVSRGATCGNMNDGTNRRVSSQQGNCSVKQKVRRRIPDPIVSATASSMVDLGYLAMPPGVNSPMLAEEPTTYPNHSGGYLATSQHNAIVYPASSQPVLYPPRTGNPTQNNLPTFSSAPPSQSSAARTAQPATGSPNATNTSGTTVANFNLSTIFPEINDKQVPPASSYQPNPSKNVASSTVGFLPHPQYFRHPSPQVCRMQWS